MELIAQGVANIASPLFGGIPATGAIARTATNVKNGGRTPVAGIIHAITLLLITLFFGRWAALIPMGVLAAILVVVAYHMSEWRKFKAEFSAPKSAIAVLLVPCGMTVLVDCTVAVEAGMVLGARAGGGRGSGGWKAGPVGRRMAGTLTSTGTPAVCLHPMDSVHGDLGIVGSDDVAILLSKSGESDELLALLEHLQGLGVRSIGIIGQAGSALARPCSVSLDAWVREEACPHDPAPTHSPTTAPPPRDAHPVACPAHHATGPAAHPDGQPTGTGNRLHLRRPDLAPAGDLLRRG